jgi:peptide chain release factor 2
VRVTHLPTGLVADIHHERSQHKNDAMAHRLLRGRYFAFTEDQKLPEAERLYGERGAVRTGRTDRSYVLHPYRRVHHPRTGADTADTDAVLDGDIRLFLAAALRALTPPAGA